MIDVDLFAGVGWDLAARRLGLDPVGFEMDADAVANRAAAGMRTVGCDLSMYPPPKPGSVRGLIASPPCQSFSIAGKRAGLADPRGELAYAPLRWVEATRPIWCAWEQVPQVLPIWRQCALAEHVLRQVIDR